MTPEEKARIKIDQWFADAGWKVVNREDYEPTCTAVAIREGLLKGNLEADYFLFINGKAVGVLEAKREETDAFASEVCEQAALYARSVPNIYQAYQKPLPFIFTSNGKELYCCDFREQDSCFRQIMNIPTPHELVKRLGIDIIRKSKFPQNPKRSVRFSGKRTKRSVQKRKARNTQKAETKVL